MSVNYNEPRQNLTFLDPEFQYHIKAERQYEIGAWRKVFFLMKLRVPHNPTCTLSVDTAWKAWHLHAFWRKYREKKLASRPYIRHFITSFFGVASGYKDIEFVWEVCYYQVISMVYSSACSYTVFSQMPMIYSYHPLCSFLHPLD